MAKQQPGKTASGTNIQHVKQKNQQAAQGQQQGQAQFGTEFAQENTVAGTDVQKVKQQNQKSQQKKSQQQQ